MTLSFTLLAQLNNKDAIALVSGTNREGGRISAYMRMNKKQLQDFSRAIARKQRIDFSDFGEVILACNGDPDEPLRRLMEVEYGFKHADENPS